MVPSLGFPEFKTLSENDWEERQAHPPDLLFELLENKVLRWSSTGALQLLSGVGSIWESNTYLDPENRPLCLVESTSYSRALRASAAKFGFRQKTVISTIGFEAAY